MSITKTRTIHNKENLTTKHRMIEKIKKYKFLFEELVSRDFKEKYKRTILGMLWSVLFPILNLTVISLVMTRFFGRSIQHYNVYLFCGTLVMSYYRESTIGGMNSLMANRGIITKIKIPKYMFLLSKNVSSLINFSLSLMVFFVFCILDKIAIGAHFIMLLFVVICLVVFNVGIGLILSALFVFFKDVGYLYDVFLVLLNYLSAIFYKIDAFSPLVQRLFLCNPIYVYIHYFRVIVIDGNIPSFHYHLLCLFYSFLSLGIGAWFYKKYNHQFLYYM